MPILRVLIFGIRSSEPGLFRLQNELIDAKNVGDVLGYLSNLLDVEFEPEDKPDIAGTEPTWFRLCQSGIRLGTIGVYVEREGKRVCAKQDLDYTILENDLIIIGSVA